MKNSHLRRLIIFGCIVLTGLMIIQIYWFRKAFDIEEHQLDHRVQVALLHVADSLSATAEVRKLSSAFYFVAAEANVDGKDINRLVRSEFEKRNLSLDYELGVYNAEDDTLVYGQYVEATRKSKYDQQVAKANESGEVKNFAVYFPRKESHVFAQMDIWLFSTLALLLMMGFFGWSIIVLLKERRFAEMKNDFINNMTHEFKTPVTNIGIATEILKKKLHPDAGLEVYLDILAKENERLKCKIEKVLLGSSGAQQRSSLEKIDIHQLIADCAESFELKVRERDGTLNLSLQAKNSFILGDRELLAQAINNIIDNAEKYSPSRPQITVRTCDDGDAIRVEIQDRGSGIPEKFRLRVFEKFFRAQHGDVHNVKGFGLGLSFVENVIRTHRGKVTLLSVVGEGTEVKIQLPRQ